MPELLTAQEVADELDLTIFTIRGYLKSGDLNGAKIGGWKVRREDLDKFISEKFND